MRLPNKRYGLTHLQSAQQIDRFDAECGGDPYSKVGKEFLGGHFSVRHSIGEYSSGGCHTNTIEGFFSIMKRGMRGYQWCAEKHLHRHLAEFDFRYTNREATDCNDSDRADRLLRGIVRKRLTYQTTLARA